MNKRQPHCSNMLLLVAVVCVVASVGATCEGPPGREAASVTLQTSAPSQAVSPSESAWPLFRHDAQASGVARCRLMPPLRLAWIHNTESGSFESSVAISDGMVYAACANGNLYALDLTTGEKRWTFVTEVGFVAAPAVKGDLLCIGDMYGVFYCLDRETGKLRWKYETQGEIDSSANFLDDCVVFGSQDSYLYCIELATGTLRWKYQSEDQIRCFPSIDPEKTVCFIAGCDGKLHIVDLKTGKLRGFVDLGGPTGNAPAVLGDLVFVGTEMGVFYGINWRKRQPVWKFVSKERAMAYRSSAAVTPAAVVVGSRDRTLRAFDPKTGKQLWQFKAGRKIDSSPVIAGSLVWFGCDDGYLYCLQLKDGRLVWKYDLGDALVASPAIAENHLVIGTQAGQLFCFRSASE